MSFVDRCAVRDGISFCACFFKISNVLIFLKSDTSSAHCVLHNENRSICCGVVKAFTSHTFQHKRYISFACTGRSLFAETIPYVKYSVGQCSNFQ